MFELNEEQSKAVNAMAEFLTDPDKRLFLLSGSAGTGKTFCIQELSNRAKGKFVYTAPTNKATKVLRDTLTRDDFNPVCRTIYSLLGLKLEANGEVKELVSPEDPVDLGEYKAVVVDEASMINGHLFAFIRSIAHTQKVKFIFMGDAAQLPPVKELWSLVWDACEVKAELTKVMRHDNQILTLATMIRGKVDHPAPTVKLVSDNDFEQGVWSISRLELLAEIYKAADAGDFHKLNAVKAIAWRNKVVDELNAAIRERIYGAEQSKKHRWLPTDRVIVTEPAKDADDNIIATIDDEGTVTGVVVGTHPVWTDFKVLNVSVTMDNNKPVVFKVLHPDSQFSFDCKSTELAVIAKTSPRKWRDYWEFRESFHSIRHGYAITAHRAQGSTYETVFVDWRDILTNPNRQEAFRCLYVACTRPKKKLYLG